MDGGAHSMLPAAKTENSPRVGGLGGKQWRNSGCESFSKLWMGGGSWPQGSGTSLSITSMRQQVLLRFLF